MSILVIFLCIPLYTPTIIHFPLIKIYHFLFVNYKKGCNKQSCTSSYASEFPQVSNLTNCFPKYLIQATINFNNHRYYRFNTRLAKTERLLGSLYLHFSGYWRHYKSIIQKELAQLRQR